MATEGSQGSFWYILTRFKRAYESLRYGSVEADSYIADRGDPLVEAKLPDRYVELERYWAKTPFSFISICFDEEEESEVYHVSTPTLSQLETELLNNLRADVHDHILYQGLEDEDITSESALNDAIRRVLVEYGVNIDVRSFYRIAYHLDREFRGFGELQPLLNDQYIEDISCDGADMPIFVYHSGYDNIKTNIQFPGPELEDIVIQLAQASGRQVSIGSPITNATLPDGSRAELVYADEVSPNGSAFTIRKYAEETMTPVELINFGTLSVEQMAYFWMAIEYNKNLVFTGGTASGKTTSLNAVSMFMPPRSKVITIEDTREISLSHDNWLSNITRERGNDDENIEMFDLLRSALRHRPEYIIVGEIRGEEATTLFQAMNTGHTTFSTMHADSVQTVINRLENNPINIPRAMIQSLDILSVQRLVRVDEDRERRSDHIAEIEGIDQRTGELNYSGLYDWDGGADTFEGDYRSSTVLEDIRKSEGWSESELLDEFNNRKLVLQYLVDEDINDLREFTSVIKKYARDPNEVIGEAESTLEDVDEIEMDADETVV